jgi:steroid delta-isomerase-like uncharacterized protein
MRRYHPILLLLGVWLAWSSLARAAEVAALERLLDEWGAAWTAADPNRLLRIFSDDIVYEDVTFGAVNKGQDALRKFATDTFDAFPGSIFEVKSRFVSEDGKWGSVEWLWRGRQTKDVPGLPATNTAFVLRGASVMEFRDGKISRNSDYWDLETLRKRVGLIK